MEQTELVIGNSTIDAIISKDNISYNGYEVFLEHEGIRLEIAVKEDKGTIKPGIEPGGKYEAKDYFAGKVQEFPKREQFGGGGYNSVSYLRKLLKDSGTIHYLDVSNPSLDTSVPGESLADKLRQQDIEPEFLCMRPIPLNLVFGDRSDKIIIKSPLKTAVMNQYTKQKAADLIRKAYDVLFNSLKDESLASIVLEESRRKGLLMGVITKSLDPDYVLKQIVPYCVCQFNYDEFGCVVNPDHKVQGDENDRIESAIEGIRNLRKGYNATQNIYVTLGRNGVLCSDIFGIYHVRLKNEKLEEINAAITSRDDATCGAGDAFAASVFKYEMIRDTPIELIAKLACRDAVRFLGYRGEVRDWDFETTKLRL